MTSKTRLTSFAKLSAKNDLGVALGRLMIALNDLGIANDALGHWIGPQSGVRASRQAGAKMYFVRVLISHTFEALKIINKIKSSEYLMERICASAAPIQTAFFACSNVIGTDRYKLLKSVRNNIGFHYSDEIVKEAIASQMIKAPDVLMSISIGDDPLEWHHQPGDRIVDSSVVRGIFRIPEDADVQPEVDRLMHDLQAIGDNFALFAGQFIMENSK